MMAAEKQILEGTAAIKTLESIYADKKLSAEIKKINADAVVQEVHPVQVVVAPEVVLPVQVEAVQGVVPAVPVIENNLA